MECHGIAEQRKMSGPCSVVHYTVQLLLFGPSVKCIANYCIRGYGLWQVQMKVGDKYLSLSITVLESKDVDFLFGLDMLRRYQCSIDLLKNVLRFPSINLELPFLAEHELPIGARHPLPAEEAPIASGANPGLGQLLSNVLLCRVFNFWFVIRVQGTHKLTPFVVHFR